jgi:LEA14-like dessication related protein
MKSISLLLFSVLSAGLLLSGCATAPQVSGVSVTVVGFRPDETSPVQTRAIMTLKFTSENVNGVGITSTTHELYLGKRYVGKAENPVAVGIPPMGSLTQDVVFNLEEPGVVRQVLSLTSEPPYRLETTLFYTDDGSKRRLKVTSEGKVALLGLEQAAR